MGEAGETSGLLNSIGLRRAEVRPEASPVFSVHSRRGGVLSSFSNPSGAPECPGPVLSPMVERDHRLPPATGRVQYNAGPKGADKLGDAA